MRKLITILLLCICMCGCERHRNHAFNEGVEAKKAGVPANANPYINSVGDAANHWLNGWMAGERK